MQNYAERQARRLGEDREEDFRRAAWEQAGWVDTKTSTRKWLRENGEEEDQEDEG